MKNSLALDLTIIGMQIDRRRDFIGIIAKRTYIFLKLRHATLINARNSAVISNAEENIPAHTVQERANRFKEIFGQLISALLKFCCNAFAPCDLFQNVHKSPRNIFLYYTTLWIKKQFGYNSRIELHISFYISVK